MAQYEAGHTEKMLDRTIMIGEVANKSMENALNSLSKRGFITGRNAGGDNVEVRLTKKGYQFVIDKLKGKAI